jgi:trigger factor
MTEKQGKENVTISHTDNSEVRVSGTISWEMVASYRKKALKRLGENLAIPGFRKGHVPENILLGHIGEASVLEEMAHLSLADTYPHIVSENNLDIIGRPSITITKLAVNTPLSFTIEAALMPVVSLPDYRAIAKKEMAAKETTDVTDKEFDEALLEIRKNIARMEKQATVPKDGEATPTEKAPEPTADEPLPELTDAVVQNLGPFETVEHFKKALRDNMLKEKETRVREKKRAAMLERIVEKATIPLPKILTDGELEKMVGQFKDDIARAGVSFDAYLARIKKTEEDLRKEWRPDAEKRARIQLSLNEIAKEEKLSPASEDVDRDVAHLREHYKTADPDHIRVYVMTILTNEKVLAFLESQRQA